MTHIEKYYNYSKAAAERKKSRGDIGNLSWGEYCEDSRQLKIQILFSWNNLTVQKHLSNTYTIKY